MGVKIEVFDLFSYFGFYFLAESGLLDVFHAKEFIFGGFVEFQFFVFVKWPILLKNDPTSPSAASPLIAINETWRGLAPARTCEPLPFNFNMPVKYQVPLKT